MSLHDHSSAAGLQYHTRTVRWWCSQEPRHLSLRSNRRLHRGPAALCSLRCYHAIVPDSALHTSRAPRRHRFWRGVRLGTPVFAGYVPIGAAFGIVAVSVGFTVTEAVSCSAIAFAGAGQFIALSLINAGQTAIAVLAATTILNLRHVLFGVTLSPYLKGMPLGSQALLGFTLTDETFAINISDCRSGRSSGASMAGVGAVAWTGWVLGTLLGATATGLIGDPTRWGVQFAMPAMFAALFIALAEDKKHVLVGILAGVLVLALPSLSLISAGIPGSWHVVIASVLCATIASLVSAMSDALIWTVILGMGVSNFALRFIPIADGIANRSSGADPAVALLHTYLGHGRHYRNRGVRPGGEALPPLSNPYLIAAVPTALVYYKTRSLLGSVLVGVAVFVLLNAAGIELHVLDLLR